MKVREYIAEMQKLDQDVEVVVFDYETWSYLLAETPRQIQVYEYHEGPYAVGEPLDDPNVGNFIGTVTVYGCEPG